MSAIPEHSSISEDAQIRTEHVDIEHPVGVGPRVEFHSGKIGRYSGINADTIIYGGVIIGRFTSIARNCQIACAEHPLHYLSTSLFQLSELGFDAFPNDPKQVLIRKIPNTSPPWRKRGLETSIGNDVWIGANAIILRGITIGDGAVIAAGSVVVNDVAPYAVVGGNPACLLKHRFDNKTIAELLAIRWWDRPIEELAELPFDDVFECMRRLKKSLL